MGKAFVDRSGECYGKLTVIKYVGISPKDKYRLWECQCECGNVVTVNYRELSSGDTKSCGCLFKEARKLINPNRKSLGESAFNQLYFSYKKSAKERGYCFEITPDTFRTLTQSNCYYCNTPPSQKVHTPKATYGGYIYTGIDRINNIHGYTLDNVRPCCKTCNSAKGSLSEQEFLEWVSRVLTHRSQQEDAN